MEVKITLDADDEVLVRYYAEVMEMSVEDAFKDALFDKIRQMYEAQAEKQPRQKCTYVDDPIENEDDMFADEDR